MSEACGKCRSTWCKCQLSHDLFSPRSLWYLYLGQQRLTNHAATSFTPTQTRSVLLLPLTHCIISDVCLRGVSHAVIKEKVLTYLSFALNQGWHKDGHLVRVWQWKTPDSSVTHIEAKRSFSCIQFHSTERNSLLSKLDTSSCGAVPQCIAWCAPPAQSEFKQRLTFSADRQSFLKTSHLSSVWQDTGSCVSADVVWQIIFFLVGGVDWLEIIFFFQHTWQRKNLKKENKKKKKEMGSKKFLGAWSWCWSHLVLFLKLYPLKAAFYKVLVHMRIPRITSCFS